MARELDPRLRFTLKLALAFLATRMFAGVLYEYRHYFPPNFDASPFLSGRRFTFDAAYRVAFYTHIAAGPLTMVLAVFSIVTARVARRQPPLSQARTEQPIANQILTGQPPAKRLIHRWVGRFQLAIVFGLMLPSGLAMAARAYGGSVSQAGFLSLTLATATTAAIGWRHARLGNHASHRRWMMRCAVLLMSPLLLRVIAGICMRTGIESEATYQINAWVSWIVPVIGWETQQRFKSIRKPRNVVSNPSPIEIETS